MPPLQGVCRKRPQEAWGTQLGPCQQEGNGSSEKRRGFAVFSGDATSSRPGRDVGSGGGGLWGQMRGYSADGGQPWEHEVDSSQTLRVRSTSWRSQRGGPQEGPGQIPRRPRLPCTPRKIHVDMWISALFLCRRPRIISAPPSILSQQPLCCAPTPGPAAPVPQEIFPHSEEHPALKRRKP